MKFIQNGGKQPELRDQVGRQLVGRAAKAGAVLLKIGSIARLIYVVGMSIFGFAKYGTTTSTLLSYGMPNATGSSECGMSRRRNVAHANLPEYNCVTVDSPADLVALVDLATEL